ncbi:hypothetical protein DFH06DRAFT_1343284 [Mycena polygramma]|nr:hypothetical protein DFH06DRAFT_1343284 [Mycena polygramma]
MSFLAAVHREVAIASNTIIRIAAPTPARCPRVVVPVQPPACAEFATICFWSDNTTPSVQSASVAGMRPRTQRSTSEAPQPLPRITRAVMKRRETDIISIKSAKENLVSFGAGKVTLTRCAAIKRPTRRTGDQDDRRRSLSPSSPLRRAVLCAIDIDRIGLGFSLVNLAMALLPTEIIHEILLYLTPFNLAKISASYSESDTWILMKVLPRTLPRLGCLEQLRLWLPTYNDALFMALAQLTLPSLRRFCCHQPGQQYDPILAAFLASHPALTHLEIIRPFGYAEPPSDILPPVALPALREYRGSLTFFLRISVAERRLAHAAFWDVPITLKVDKDWRGMASALALTTTPRATQFAFRLLFDYSHSAGLVLEILRLLGRHVPYLHSVEVGPFLNLPYRPGTKVLQRIADTLEGFTHLAVFAFNNSIAGAEVVNDSVESDRAAVALWGERCPSLLTIQLRMDRRRRRTTLKLPPEICAKICEDLGPKDRVTLCRTSRLFGDQAQHLIYRTVNLRHGTPRAIRSWCLAVTHHSHLAERVYALSLGLPLDLASSSDLGKIARALSRCLNLKELSIHHDKSGPFGASYESAESSIQGWLITKCAFRLTKFSNSFFKNSFLSQFWTPQSDIRVLSIPTCSDKFPCYEDQLPNLIALEVGDVKCLPTDRALERIQLRWRRYSSHSLDQLSALGKFSVTLTTLTLVAQGPTTHGVSTLQTFEKVAHHLPGLLHFGVTDFTQITDFFKLADRYSEPSPIPALARFTRLETFVFYTQTVTGFEDLVLGRFYALGDEPTLRIFGLAIMKACPTLRRADIGARIFPDVGRENSHHQYPRRDRTCTLTRTSTDEEITEEYETRFDFHAVSRFWSG